MNYCARCLYPENHPLGLVFDAEGVCSGCRVHEEKDQLDWEERWKALELLVDSYRNRSQTNFDCIVPVSGGRDSWFVVETVVRRLGLRPLLVSYNKHYNTRVGIRNLAHLRTIFDANFIQRTVNPESVKRITRASLRLCGSLYWHVLAGETVYPVQAAVHFKIPLIIWGVHQGVDQVGMYSHLQKVEMTRKYRKEHDLMGWEAEDLAVAAHELKEKDWRPYVYPHDKQIESAGVRGIYLSNYIRWDTKKQHERMIGEYGYMTFPQHRTFDSYNDVDSHHYSGLHDWLKVHKVGFGKVLDHATREIRLGRLSREEGVRLVKHWQNNEPNDTNLFLDWLGWSRQEFFGTVEPFRNQVAWENGREGWRLRQPVYESAIPQNAAAQALERRGTCDFVNRLDDAEWFDDRHYVLFGKGFPR